MAGGAAPAGAAEAGATVAQSMGRAAVVQVAAVAAQESRASVCACCWGATTGGSGQNQGSRTRRLW